MTGPVLETDLLIIGLGPAGASAARLAAGRGLSVMALDKKAEAGLPVQCAEYIPLPLHAHCGVGQASVQRVERLRTHLPGQEAELSPLTGMMIERAIFDRQLCERARAEGAELHFSTRLSSLSAAERLATLQSARGRLRVRYRYLLAADGPHSRVARLLGLPPLECLYSYQRQVALAAPMADTEVWLGDDYPGGYAWLFPKGTVANLGVAGYRDCGAALKRALHTLQRRLAEEGRIEGPAARASGGLIPVGGIRTELVYEDRILFCGDAAGLCHPISGAGIASAVLSAELAAESMAEDFSHPQRVGPAYETAIRELYASSWAHAIQRRRELRLRWLQLRAYSRLQLRRAWFACDEYRECES